jgi:hypothetical protein
MDDKNWHVKQIHYFLQHTPDLMEHQGFHVDIMSHYLELKKKDNFKGVKYDNFGGYLIFIGMEKVNTLWIGEADHDNSKIINEKLISFPFKSILVISDFLPHAGNMFTNKKDLNHTGTHDTTYSLKGFLSINEFGEEIGTVLFRPKSIY